MLQLPHFEYLEQMLLQKIAHWVKLSFFQIKLLLTLHNRTISDNHHSETQG